MLVWPLVTCVSRRHLPGREEASLGQVGRKNVWTLRTKNIWTLGKKYLNAGQKILAWPG